MNKKILYIVSGRSFIKSNLMRKIEEVINIWGKRTNSLRVILGGELRRSSLNEEHCSYVPQHHYDNVFRNNAFTIPIVHTLSEAKDIYHDITMFFHLKKFRGEKFELIIERSSRLHISGLLYAKINDVKYCLEWKDNLLNYNISGFKWLGFIYEKAKLKYSDYIIVESSVLKEFISNKYNISKDKIFVALNAVNSSEFCSSFKKHNESKVTIGYLGSYAFYHNPQLLISSINYVIKRRPDLKNSLDVRMVGNGLYLQECKSLTKKYGLEGIIKFSSGVSKDKVSSVLSEFDIGVLPGSTDIICPIKIFEYMASDLITVAPNYKCNQEVIIDGYNGFLFKPNDVESLATNIIRIVSDIEKYRLISKNGRDDVANKYNWDKTWGAVLDLLLRKI